MSITFPNVQVGEPVCHEALSVFPLFAGLESPVEYLLSDEGIASGVVTVKEVSEGGSVPNLLVENKGDIRILFIEGEQLIGAKQNRVLNTSVLITAKSKVKIPVSCVEQGRWDYTSRHFDSSTHHSPPKIRAILKNSVTDSLLESGSYQSDQARVWMAVSRYPIPLERPSETGALSDVFEDNKETVDEFQDKLKYVDGACGVAAAIGKKIVAMDLFDKPSTCQKVWNRLLSGFVLDALEAKADEGQAEAADVQDMLGTASRMTWVKTEPIGEGDEYRAQQGEEVHASALAFHDVPVHFSVVVAG